MHQLNKKAFTLIELLVVIAVIALLIGMLMPSLTAARERARQVVCKAQLRDIGFGLQAYASDYNDKFPDKDTLGGFNFRAAPGYKNPDDPMGLPERFGMAAVLDENNCIDGTSKIWVCPSQPHRWMRKLGNTYAFSTATMLSYTKTYKMKRYSKTWLIWDNYILKPYTPGLRATGSNPGFTIPSDERKYPHSFSNRGSKGTIILYADGHSGTHIDQD